MSYVSNDVILCDIIILDCIGLLGQQYDLASDLKKKWSPLLKIKKKLFVLRERLILTRYPQISGQNNSEAREPEGLVKIIYGIIASPLFKRAGNSN